MECANNIIIRDTRDHQGTASWRASKLKFRNDCHLKRRIRDGISINSRSMRSDLVRTTRSTDEYRRQNAQVIYLIHVYITPIISKYFYLLRMQDSMLSEKLIDEILKHCQIYNVKFHLV